MALRNVEVELGWPHSAAALAMTLTTIKGMLVEGPETAPRWWGGWMRREQATSKQLDSEMERALDAISIGCRALS